MKRTALITVLVFLVLQGVGNSATPGTSSEIITDRVIRDWLSSHPEVVDKLIRESMLRQGAELLPEIQKAQIAKQKAEADERLRINLPRLRDQWLHDPMVGRAGTGKSGVVVVAFEDNECPFCKALQPNLNKLIEDRPDITILYREFAILGPVSVQAAKAAMAAIKQNKYAELHKTLMASKIAEHALTDKNIFEMAESVGVDVEKLKADMQAPEIESALNETRNQARLLGINGTPGLIIDNQLVGSQMPYEQLLATVDAAAKNSR